MNTYAWDAGLPCKNPNCKSHGKPHPNCKCYSGGGEEYAQGGSVCAIGMKHMPGCEYYADGGPVPPPLYAEGGDVTETPRITKGHSGAYHGLLGLLTKVGHSSMAEPDKHVKVLEDAKNHWSRLQDPVDAMGPHPKTMGVRFADNMAQGKHEEAAGVLQDHPLVGSVGKKDLTTIVQHLHGPLMSSQANPEAMRSSVDYLHSAIKGFDSLKMKASSLFDKKHEPINPDRASREMLKKEVDQLSQDPAKMLDIGGNLGHYLPDQSTELVAYAASAVSYLSTLKPKQRQTGPFGPTLPPSKTEEMNYDRQVDIAQQPLLILDHVRNGTLLPQDLTTLTTIYPGLYQSLMKQTANALIEAKEKNRMIPQKQKQALSLLLNQPLDANQTPQVMMSIMAAQGPQQAQLQSKGKPSKDKATDVELRQINKVDEMGETSLEARQIHRNKS